MNKKELFLFLLTAIILSLIGLQSSVLKNVTHAETRFMDRTETKLTLTSDPRENKYRYIELRNYPFVTNWPKKIENCGGTATQKKEMPFLGDASEWNSSWPNGNQFAKSGNCSARYTNGGTANTNALPYVDSQLYGNWSFPGTMAVGSGTGWNSNPPLVWSAKNECVPEKENGDGELCSEAYKWGPAIWGLNHRFGYAWNEHVDHHKDLAYRVNGSYPPNWYVDPPANSERYILTSSGTTLFRNEFTMTESEKSRLNEIYMNVASDDWSRIFINGIQIASWDGSSDSGYNHYEVKLSPTSNPTTFDAIKNSIIADGITNNVLAFQVTDKSRWVKIKSDGSSPNTAYTSKSNSAQLYYHTEFKMYPKTLNVELMAEPASGTAPLLNVDLIARVGGNTVGNIEYKFDCDNNGTWEYITPPVLTNPYTAVDLCNYNSPGQYIAGVTVSRDGKTASNTVIVTVTQPNVNQEPYVELISPENGAVFTTDVYGGTYPVQMSARITDPDNNEFKYLFIRYWSMGNDGSCSTNSVIETGYGWAGTNNNPLLASWNQNLKSGKYCWTSYGHGSKNLEKTLWPINGLIRTFEIKNPNIIANCYFDPSTINSGDSTELNWVASGVASATISGPDFSMDGLTGSVRRNDFMAGQYILYTKDLEGKPITSVSCPLTIRSLSCTLKPREGNIPLLVQITASSEGLDNDNVTNYEFELINTITGNSLVKQSQRATEFFYNLNQEGTYKGIVSAKSGENVIISDECTSTVTAINPAGGGGGEVTP